MATTLDKDLIRESTLKHNDREILVTITADQKISMKLKGLKSGIVSIAIDELFRQLSGEEVDSLSHLIESGAAEVDSDSEDTQKTNKTQQSWLDKNSKDNPMIPLNDLRTDMNSSPLPFATRVQLEGFLVNTINKAKKPFLDAEARVRDSNLKRK